MTDMHGFGDIGPAEIEHSGLAPPRLGQSAVGTRRQPLQTLLECSIREAKIDKAWPGDGDVLEQSGLVQSRTDAFGDLARVGFRLSGGGERAVALKLREIR